MHSLSEQNYLKTIFKLQQENGKPAQTNDISKNLGHKPASVSEMLAKLSDKKLIHYKKYQGVQLSEKGKKQALSVIRKHRLWEVFLVQQLGFTWDEVHDIAEQLEHIESDELVSRLDTYLGKPKYDPHGDPIPDRKGKIPAHKTLPLSSVKTKGKYQLAGVSSHSNDFLKHISALGIKLNDTLMVKERMEYDQSVVIEVNRKQLCLTGQVSAHLQVIKL